MKGKRYRPAENNEELAQAFTRLTQIRKELHSFAQRNAAILDQYHALMAEAKAQEDLCRTITQRTKQGGTFPGGSVLVTIPKERVVDSRKLLKILPTSAKWPGLFRVSLSVYDAARCSIITDDVDARVRAEIEGTPRTAFKFV